MHISEVETPAIVVDLDIMERNLGRVADYAREHGLRLRPHTKTHKSVRLARRQLELGAAGLTVAKTGEAEVMLEAEPEDLLVAFPIVGRAKLERLMAVARRARVTVALDSIEAARPLSDAAQAAQVEVGVLAETDVGLGRVGVPPGSAADGAGRVHRASCPVSSSRASRSIPATSRISTKPAGARWGGFRSWWDRSCADFRRAGIEVKIVSGGSTPTLFHSHEIEGLNEIRPGTYVFNDLNTVRDAAPAAMEDCAAAILATVVSTARARPDRSSMAARRRSRRTGWSNSSEDELRARSGSARARASTR